MDILQLIIHDIAITPSKNRKRKKIKLEFKYFDIIKSANEGGHFSPSGVYLPSQTAIF